MQIPTRRSRTTQSPAAGRRGPRALVGLLAASSLVLSGCGGGGGGTEGEPADSGSDALITEGTLVAASSGEYRPFSYYEGDELVGFDKDIADAVATEMGLQPDTQTGRFDTLVQGLQSRRYDVVIGSMTPTPERDNAVDFTDGYYTSGAQMFVREDSDCSDPRAMDAPVVGVASGTTYQTFIEDEGLAGEVKTYGSDVTALTDLASGRLDGVVTDKLVGLNQVNEAEQPLRTCGELLFSEEPAFAVRDGNTALVEDLNAALAAIKEDGTYAELSEKWFGQDIS
ncbi:transporter substrate-binding domain-containing protein [Auraticoccus monumenti]|uniref:Amino acid ABC transporter substrate-binding protein, PAAT family n=1 Tax=Auraticoccus monumenti TaxID=675864 RepID=A0A1G6SRM7_9ACTN|nr:transporter substrate-binding domain-containing protein [Auraticoccus monumenti]SDD19469.1 amino acid ABC transporter substrate-binding protein, PAAT family [Auraticoccus monumenti]